MTARRAAAVVALVSACAYLPSLSNGFALDDTPIVEDNPAAHSMAAAVRGAFDPYWPPEHRAGLWRPLTILSFAVDWELSGGRPALFHLTNLVLHASASALLVAVLAAFVAPAGALAGALLFAVHPVHVEAVANVVGRSELLVAVFLFAAVLAARAVRRRRESGRSTGAMELGLCLLVVLALLSKEHAVIAVPLLWIEERALRRGGPGLPWRTWVALVCLSVLWLLAYRELESGLAFRAVAPTFYDLDAAGRISTMLPVVLHVVRLLAWPFDLSPDYHPQVVERLEAPTAVGVAGALLLAALAALAILCWRRHRAHSAGLLLIGLAWLPTANLLFPTGIVLAERTLYLASAGLALVVGALWDAAAKRAPRPVATVVLAAALAPLLARTVVQIPVWRSTRDLVIGALLVHPESYRVHQAAARVYRRLGQRAQALDEYRVGVELFAGDPYMLSEAAGAALNEGRTREALRYLRMSESRDAYNTVTLHYMAEALLRADSAAEALEYARRAVASGPADPESARVLASSWVALGEADSALAVWPAFEERGGSGFERRLLGAVTLAALGSVDSAVVELGLAERLVPQDTIAQRRLEEVRAMIAAAAGVP